MVRVPETGPVKLFGKLGLTSCLILILVVWFGNFFEFDRFSLNADDWCYLGTGATPDAKISCYLGPGSQTLWTASGWLDGIRTYAGGRIGQWSLNYLLGVLIHYSGSLATGYIFLFLITALSVLATWWALTYRFSNTVALVAAIVLAISPLVSVRPFLNGIASPAALFFLMISGILYVSDKKILSYLVSILIIICYELVFPLFVFLPILLKPIRSRRDVYKFIGHAAICAAMIATDAVIITLAHGNRLRAGVGDHSDGEVLVGIMRVMVKSVQSGLSGSVNVSSWFNKLHGMADVQIWGVLAFAGFVLLLHRAYRAYRAAPIGAGGGPSDRRLLAQSLAILLLMAMAGYALVYFVSPLGAGGVLGRESRFHSAANLPLSILTAMVLVGLSRISPRGWIRHGVIAAEAGYLAAMFAFSVSHQNDFALAAERHRLVVTQLAIDHPMMDPQATFIIRFADIAKRDRQSIEYDDTYSWYPMLRTLFEFPGNADGPAGPVIRIVRQDSWPQYLTPGPDDRLDWTGLVFPRLPEQAGHIWYYELSLDGVLTPLRTPIMVGGRNILHEGPDLADGAVNLGRLPKRPYFDLIMGPDAAIIEAAARKAEAAPAESAALAGR
jgi:hypothetical protein